MSHVFISYQNADSDFAALLMLQLERAEIDTWMDKERLRPGFDWSEAIDAAIQNAFAMVLVMSPDAKASEYVTYEWAHALGAGVRVIPVLIRETQIHPRLARIQYLKFTDPSLRPWDALIRELREAQNTTPVLHLPRSTPAYIKRAVADLDSANPDDRKVGITCLAAAPEVIATDALAYALKHELVDVRIGATIALAQRGDRRALIGMPEALASDEGYLAMGAIAKLGTAAHASIVEWLETGRTDLRVTAARLLGETDSPEAIPALMRALESDDGRLKAEAIISLARKKAESVLTMVIDILRDPSSKDLLTRAAIKALGILAPPDAATILIDYLQSMLERAEHAGELSASVPWDAARALGSIGNCTLIAKIASHLSSSNPATRILVARTIGQLKCPDYVSPLSSLLEDKAKAAVPMGYFGFDLQGLEQVGEAARVALREIGTAEALAALGEL